MIARSNLESLEKRHLKTQEESPKRRMEINPQPEFAEKKPASPKESISLDARAFEEIL